MVTPPAVTIKAGDDCAHLFDATRRYASRDALVDELNATTASLGFRLWIGDGRKDKAGGPSMPEIDLACSRFRSRDANGKRSRVGGCKFMIRAKQVCDNDGAPAWTVAGGNFEHNHDCGPPLKLRKKNGTRFLASPTGSMSNEPPPKRQKLSPLVAAAAAASAQSSAPAPVHVASAYDPNQGLPLPLDFDINDFGDADLPSDSDEEDEASTSPTNAAVQLALSQFLKGGTGEAWPNGSVGLDFGLDALSGELGEEERAYLATAVADNGTFGDLLGREPTRVAAVSSTGPAGNTQEEENVPIRDFLIAANPQLAAYADAFEESGCPDTRSLFALDEENLRGFVEDDLPGMCELLKKKPFHRRLLLSTSDHIDDALLAKKGYAYICGEGKFMAREVEHLLEDILGKGKGGGHAEGVKELKLLKDRNRLLLDVWS